MLQGHVVVLGERGRVQAAQLGPEHRTVVVGAVGAGGRAHVPPPLAHARGPGPQQPHLVAVRGVQGARPGDVPGGEHGHGDEEGHQGAGGHGAVEEQDEQDARAGDRAAEQPEPGQAEHVVLRGPGH
ncbi:hypothetical protein ACFQ2H_08295 [Streptomyces violaceoruber]